MLLLRPRRDLLDRAARYAVSTGGIAVIIAILAIFFFIFREVTPLFTTPTARLLTRFTVPSDPPAQGPLYIGMDDSKTIAYTVGAEGVRFLDLTAGTAIPVDMPGLAQVPRLEWPVGNQSAVSHVTALAQGGVGSDRYVAGTEDGWILPFKMGVTTRFSDNGERIRRPLFRLYPSFRIGSDRIITLAYRTGDAGHGLAAVTAQGTLLYAKPSDSEGDQPIPASALYRFDRPVTHLALDAGLANLYAGTVDGLLYHFDLRETAEASVMSIYRVAKEGVAVSALGFLNGDHSLIVGTGDGEVFAWALTRLPGSLGRFRLERIHRLLTVHSRQGICDGR